MKKIAIIPARSGSKGLPNKNILMLQGKPLIGWTIEAAITSGQFEKVIVSTDSLEYGAISEKYGASVVYRGEEASSDTASTFTVVEDLFSKVDTKGVDYFVLLQPTSPLRCNRHIVEAIDLFEKEFDKYDTLVSVTKAHKAADLVKQINPQTLSLEYFDKDFSNYCRQGYTEYEPNGAIFISKIDTYLVKKHFFGTQGLAYMMDKKSSIDIDDFIDFKLAETVLKEEREGNGNV